MLTGPGVDGHMVHAGDAEVCAQLLDLGRALEHGLPDHKEVIQDDGRQHAIHLRRSNSQSRYAMSYQQTTMTATKG